MGSPITAAGGSSEPSEYAALTMDRQFSGLWTQRSPFRPGNVPWLQQKFYSADTYDSMTDGLNREITSRLTDARRPGSTVYSGSASFPQLRSFYPWKYIQDGAEVIEVQADAVDMVVYGAAPNDQTETMIKSDGYGPTRFLGVNTELFLANGVDLKKVLRGAKVWKPNTTYNIGDFVTVVNTTNVGGPLVIQSLQANPVDFTITGTSVIAVTIPGAVTPVNYLVVDFFIIAPVMPANQTCSFSGLTTNVALNGVTLMWRGISQAVLTVLNLSPSQIAFEYPSGTPIAPTADTGTMVALTATPGVSGPTEPNPWPHSFGALTADGTLQWTCFGESLQEWGVTAPKVTGSALNPSYTGPMTLTPGPTAQYWAALAPGVMANYAILDTLGQIQVVTTGGANGATLPTWATMVGNTTTSGTVVYTNFGQIATWYAGFDYGGATSAVPNPCCVLDVNGNIQVVADTAIAGTSGATVPVWATTVGATTTDGAITWTCLGPGNQLWGGVYQYSWSYHCIDGTVSTAFPITLLANGGIGATEAFQFDLSSATDVLPDNQIDQIWIWRTAQGRANLILLDTIPNPRLLGGTTWAYRDVSSDLQLTAQIGAPIALTANPPQAGFTAPVYHLQRVWGIIGNTVYYSAGPDAVTGNGSTQFPPLNFIPYPEQVIKLRPITIANGGILVETTSNIYVILGTGTQGNPFYTTIYVPGVGLANYNAEDVVGSTIYMLTTKGKFISLDPSAGYVEQGFPIGDQLLKVTTGGFNAALFNPATAYVSWHEQSSGDSAIYVSNGLGQWFRFSPVASPETGYVWSPIASILDGASAVQSIETSPGINQLLIGPGGSGGPIRFRDDSKSADWVGAPDTGAYEPYASWDVKGNIVLCSSGEVAEIAHVALKSAAQGARPKVSLLLGEIKATTQTPFDDLEPTSTDPPDLEPSLTYYSDRYVALQNGVCPKCDNFQLKVDYGVQDFPDELLMFAIYGAKHAERRQQ